MEEVRVSHDGRSMTYSYYRSHTSTDEDEEVLEYAQCVGKIFAERVSLYRDEDVEWLFSSDESE